MKLNGWIGAPIDVIQLADGTLTTFDNTRLLAASRAGIEVQAVIHSYSEAFPADRWLPKSGIVPETWGDAMSSRIQQQNSLYRYLYPNGSPITGSSK